MELQKDHVKTASATIQKILNNPDKEMAELIKAAQEDYKSEYLFCSWVHLLTRCSLYIPEYIF